MMREYKAVKWIRNHTNLAEALLMMFLPLLCCLVTCALEGQSIGRVYLPASEWNDELFYFKQVEGIVHYGYPQGYFGFNESHAMRLSFAAWSPVLVWPWILWGLIFGWNLHSPIYCNIFLMMAAMFGFVLLAKPTRKQMGLLALMFVTFTPFTRYMLSGMPEAICFAMVILTFSLGVSYMRREHTVKLVLLFVMTGLMTLMRPYLIVFMLLPVYFLVRKRKWLGLLLSVLAVGIVGAGYICINHYLGAEYFAPLFDTTWVTKFVDDGIFGGIKYVLYRLWTVGRTFFSMLLDGCRSGLAAGARFAGFILMMLLLFWQAFVSWRKKEKQALVMNLYLAVCFFGMWMALLLMYKMDEGSKHLLTFTAAGIFAVCLMETRFYRKAVVVSAAFVYLYVAMADNAYEYQIPYYTEERAGQIAAWEEIFDGELAVERESAPGFENAVIWLFTDQVGEETIHLPWQYLYALPEGFGISCCYQGYVLQNFDGLQSRYVAGVSGGEVERLCIQRGMRQIGNSGGMAVYEMD